MTDRVDRKCYNAMDTVSGHLIWMLFLSDIFHPAVPTVNAVLACGQIENVGPAIAGRNVTLKFIPASSQQNANVKWKRRRGTNPWSYFTNTPRFVEYEINGVYYVTITKASTGDAVDYKAEYNDADRIICTSDAATLTLIDLKDCGHLYLRSSNIIINETLEIGYYPTMDIVNSPQRYVRYWLRYNECQKGCQADHPNSKLEEILYSNNEYVLKIYHFDNSDGGSYNLQCTRGREINKFTDQVIINAPVPPSSPTLSPLETIDGFTGRIVGRDDTDVEVACRSFGGTKPLNVTIKVADTQLTVKSGDSGEYRATIRLNDTLHHMAKLVCSVDNHAITVPLTAEAYIYVIKTFTTPSVYIPSKLIEGDPVTCMVTNTRPAPTNITLLVDGSIVEGLEMRHDKDTVTLLYNSWVKLTKFKRSWNKKNLTCCVYNYGDQKICSFPQPVDLIFPPDSVVLHVVTNITQEKQSYVLKAICHIYGSNPACNATWKAPNEVILLHGQDGPNISSRYGSINSMYSAFVNVSAAENGKNITCTPACGSHFDVLPNSSWSISVPYVPVIEFNTSSSELQVFNGSIAYVTCTGISHPPSRIVWYRSDVNTSAMPCIENGMHHDVASSVDLTLPSSYHGSINECTVAIDTRTISVKTLQLLCRADHMFRSVNKSFSINIIDVQSNLHRPLPIELIGGVGGAVALVIIGTCLAVIGVCKHRKSKDDKSSPNVEEIVEYDWRHDSPSSNEEQNGTDLVYLDLKFDGNTDVSFQPVRKRWESPVLYGDIDFVKTAQSANENDCEVNEDHIYLHQ